jgi:hypothetical protein
MLTQPIMMVIIVTNIDYHVGESYVYVSMHIDEFTYKNLYADLYISLDIFRYLDTLVYINYI